MDKLYKRGYIAGVFDLFHIGHLNLINNSKQLCDYLIVGVLTDDLVVHFKQIPPFINQEERKGILEAIKGIDEVVLVDRSNIDKINAWKLYRYDCFFSGDDWKNEASWIRDKKELMKLGSNIHYFDYTKSTSSSQIKRIINKEDQANILIYGAGNFGQRALEYLGSQNVLGFIDSNPEKIGDLFCKKPVLSLEKIKGKMEEFEVVIAIKEYEQVYEYLKGQLVERGIKNISIYPKSDLEHGAT